MELDLTDHLHVIECVESQKASVCWKYMFGLLIVWVIFINLFYDMITHIACHFVLLCICLFIANISFVMCLCNFCILYCLI